MLSPEVIGGTQSPQSPPSQIEREGFTGALDPVIDELKQKTYELGQLLDDFEPCSNLYHTYLKLILFKETKPVIFDYNDYEKEIIHLFHMYLDETSVLPLNCETVARSKVLFLSWLNRKRDGFCYRRKRRYYSLSDEE